MSDWKCFRALPEIIRLNRIFRKNGLQTNDLTGVYISRYFDLPVGVWVLNMLGILFNSYSDSFFSWRSLVYCDFSVETVYSLAYGVNIKLAIVNLNMTTCKLVIQKLLLQPLLSPCSDSSAAKKKTMPTGHGVEHCNSLKLALPESWFFA